MALVIFATLFTSCQKEDITSTSFEEVKTTNLVQNPDKVTLVFPDLGPQGLVKIPIKINSTTCLIDSYSLTVTSPEVDLSEGSYSITWFKNAEQELYAVGQNLECVCGFGVRIQVRDDSGVIAAEGSYDLPNCNRNQDNQ